MLPKYIIIIGTVIVGALVATAAVAQTAADNNCLTCHRDFEEEDGPSHQITGDIHYQAGLGCEQCHGGDPTLEDMDDVRASAGYRGVPTAKDIPAFCARCHSDAGYMHDHNPSLPVDQLDKYKTSEHGRRLFGQGDTKVATCVSCHSVHTINSARLPHSSTHPKKLPFTCGSCHADRAYMAGYKIGTDQLDDYTRSVHGIALLEQDDLAAPACNDCHGNHGAAPPGVASLSAVCGLCHALESDLFDMSPHRQAFDDNELPACETCHSNHLILSPTDDMIGTSDAALCTDCHAHDDGTAAIRTAGLMRADLDSMIAARARADSMLGEARERGMMVVDEQFTMKEIDQLLIQARIAIHSLDTGEVAEKAGAGLAKADSVTLSSAQLVDEYYFRRKGAGVATLIITVLAIALYLKIRSIDAANNKQIS